MYTDVKRFGRGHKKADLWFIVNRCEALFFGSESYTVDRGETTRHETVKSATFKCKEHYIHVTQTGHSHPKPRPQTQPEVLDLRSLLRYKINPSLRQRSFTVLLTLTIREELVMAHLSLGNDRMK